MSINTCMTSNSCPNLGSRFPFNIRPSLRQLYYSFFLLSVLFLMPKTRTFNIGDTSSFECVLMRVSCVSCILIIVVCFCSPSSAPKLEYTIAFNSSRALIFQQLVFGSPNKPDGRVGKWVSVCVCSEGAHTCTCMCMYDSEFVKCIFCLSRSNYCDSKHYACTCTCICI